VTHEGRAPQARKPEEDPMSSATIPPVTEPTDASRSDAVRRQAVVRAIRERRRRAVVGTIAARYSDLAAARSWL
jgi:hypothetical protein